jgi:excisionase family DNA binding protein
MALILEQRWFSLSQASLYTGMSTESLRRLIAAGKLRAHRPTGMRLLLVDRIQLDELIEASAQPKEG